MVTIFTPTYNRAYILPKLYDSLCKQTCKDFEWLIVDDGSTDNTEELVLSWISQSMPFAKQFHISYIKQENGGKHRAINKGVKEAKGELFFIVDSDDYLTDDAVAWIIDTANPIVNDNMYAGVSGIRVFPNGKRIGGGGEWACIDSNSIEIRMKYHIDGDMAEVFKTDILRQYPFLEIEGERFCPEAYVWNRIAKHYKILYYHHPIYVCEYLMDGLTAGIIRVRRNSPFTSMTYYSELQHMKIPTVQKIKANVNFWRFAPIRMWKNVKSMKMLNVFSLIGMPVGCVYSIVDRRV